MKKNHKIIMSVWPILSIFFALIVVLLFTYDNSNSMVIAMWVFFAAFALFSAIQTGILFSKEPDKSTASFYCLVVNTKTIFLFAMMHFPFHPLINIPISIFAYSLMLISLFELFYGVVFYFHSVFKGENNLINKQQHIARILQITVFSIMFLGYAFTAFINFSYIGCFFIFLSFDSLAFFWYTLFIFSGLFDLYMYLIYTPNSNTQKRKIISMIILSLSLGLFVLSTFNPGFVINFNLKIFFGIFSTILLAFSFYSYGGITREKNVKTLENKEQIKLD